MFRLIKLALYALVGYALYKYGVLGRFSGMVAPEKRRIGLVFQDWALFPHLSVASNVAFGDHS